MKKSYSAENVDVLDFPENIRHRPTMYIGSVNDKGIITIIREIIDNSIDEIVQGHGSEIDIVLDNNAKIISITDYGRGIPLENHSKYKIPTLEVLTTIIHSGAKMSDETYDVSSGLNGVGLKAANALSTNFKIWSTRDQKTHYLAFKRGKKVEDILDTEKTKNSKTGVTVEFSPDPEIFVDAENIIPTLEDITVLLRHRAYLTPGVKFNISYDETNFSIQPTDGLTDFINEDFLVNDKNILGKEVIRLYDKNIEGSVDIAIAYGKSDKNDIKGFCNTIYQSDGGMHIKGFKLGLNMALQRYFKDYPLSGKDKNIVLESSDFLEGIYCAISVLNKNPKYEGQGKQKITNNSIQGYVQTLMSSKFYDYLIKNKEACNKIVQKAIDAAKGRIASKKAKETVKKASEANFLSVSSSKLTGCKSKNPEECEIFLVEGDSAGGSAKNGRDTYNQAILPLKGKIINVEDLHLSKILSNNEISDMINSFGCGVGKEFDISKLKYHKIIIMSDADDDGFHIRSLLLTFFYRVFPELVSAGHIYIAQPPLYIIKEKKNIMYLKDDKELAKFFAKRLSNVVIKDNTGKVMNNAILVESLLHIKKEFDTIKTRFMISNLLIESIIYNLSELSVNQMFNTIQQLADKVVSFNKDTKYINFIFENEPLAFTVNDYFVNSFNTAYKLIKKLNIDHLVFDNESYSLSDTADILDKKMKSGIVLSYLKGLGEMDPTELAETTMSPKSRTLIQLKNTKPEETDEIMQTFMMSKKVKERREILEANFENFNIHESY